MDHRLRATLFKGEILLYCSCQNWIRIIVFEGTVKDAEESWKVHKDAWKEKNFKEERKEVVIW